MGEGHTLTHTEKERERERERSKKHLRTECYQACVVQLELYCGSLISLIFSTSSAGNTIRWSVTSLSAKNIITVRGL